MSEYVDERFMHAGARAWIVRLVLVILAVTALWGAIEVRNEGAPAAGSAFEPASFWATVGLFFAVGLTFGIAVRYPFPRPRVAWGRFIFVFAMLLPAVHLWFVLAEPIVTPSGWIVGPYWFDAPEVADVGAVLAGVAAASAPGARRHI